MSAVNIHSNCFFISNCDESLFQSVTTTVKVSLFQNMTKLHFKLYQLYHSNTKLISNAVKYFKFHAII